MNSETILKGNTAEGTDAHSLKTFILTSNEERVAQTHRSMEQNREPRNRPMQIHPLILTQVQNQFSGGRIDVSTSSEEVIRYPQAKKEILT